MIEVTTLLHVADRTFFGHRPADARERLDERKWEEAWTEGRAMTAKGAIAEVLTGVLTQSGC